MATSSSCSGRGLPLLLLLLLLAVLAALAVASSASPSVPNDRIVLFRRQGAPGTWQDVGSAPPQARLRFWVALKQRNEHLLDSELVAVSDPDSPRYGQYLSREQLIQLTQPDERALRRVLDWLQQGGARIVDASMKHTVVAEAALADLERLFATRFRRFRHVSSGLTLHRHVGTLSLPVLLTPLVDFVFGLGNFPVPKPALKSTGSAPDPSQFYVAPITIRKLYNIPDGAATLKHGSTLAPIEFQGDSSFSQKELDTFNTQNSLPTLQVPQSQIIGKFQPQYPDIEATLDIQYQVGVAQGGNSSEWYWTIDDWMFEFATALGNHSTSDAPLVSSMSWGWAESHQCEDVDKNVCNQLGVDSKAYVTRVNSEFAKAGLRGFTLLAASGDAGAPSRVNEDCSGTPALNPDFPAGSPYVTSVGATVLDQPSSSFAADEDVPPICKKYQCATSAGEIACSFKANGCLYTTGGGFSNFAPQPKWQADAVKQYLASGALLPPDADFDKNGRGYCDVSALGHNFLVYVNGGWLPVDGTSASSPTFSAVLAILNDLLLGAGKSPIGFANPLLYKMGAECPQCFQDITVGSNDGTEYTSKGNCKGYGATKGWDPVSGWGTPNVANMLAYLKQMHNIPDQQAPVAAAAAPSNTPHFDMSAVRTTVIDQ